MRVSLFLLLAFAAAVVVADETIVTISSGTLQGRITRNGLARAFRGVPYAAPPTGANRWTNPRNVSNWSGVRQATMDGPGCVQNCKLPPLACPQVQSEDCLLLNVFTPRLAHISTKLPVMVWLHGGNFFQGDIAGPLYDGRYIANTTNTIVVAAQYRLGILGFAASKQLAGNYGFLDQVAALHWVQENIAAFGGDPAQVTLFGQSAGAMSVALHLSFPGSKGLFSKAIMESEPFGLPFRSPTEAAKVQAAFSKYVGCDASDLTCLRGKDADAVRSAQVRAYKDILVDLHRPLEAFIPFTPVIGEGSIIAEQPLAAFRSGNIHPMPIMLGNTRQEATLFVYEAFGKPLSKLEYDIVITAIFSLKNVFRVGERYKPTSSDTRPEASQLATDSIFLCANRNITRSLVEFANPGFDTHYYVFDHPLSKPKEIWGNDTFCYDVSCHGQELPFVFHSMSACFDCGISFTAAETELSARMSLYWANFAHTGNPNNSSALIRAAQRVTDQTLPDTMLDWPAYAGATSQSLNFSTPDTIDNFFDNDVCNWWDTEIGYVWP